MTDHEVGVGPHPEPWPDDPRLDPHLLAKGDRRNVLDRYRYWTRAAIVADLDTRRHQFHVAIENWQHDFNIGTVVRNANAFLAAEVHIVGKRRWNRRGAMMTDTYQHVEHHGALGGDLRRHLQLQVGVDELDRRRVIDQDLHRDALTAFVINAGLIWAAWESFDNELYALGGVISLPAMEALSVSSILVV